MAETYYQKLARRMDREMGAEENFKVPDEQVMARILEEELSGIIKLLNDAADSLDMEGLDETANRIKAALAERGLR